MAYKSITSSSDGNGNYLYFDGEVRDKSDWVLDSRDKRQKNKFNGFALKFPIAFSDSAEKCPTEINNMKFRHFEMKEMSYKWSLTNIQIHADNKSEGEVIGLL